MVKKRQQIFEIRDCGCHQLSLSFGEAGVIPAIAVCMSLNVKQALVRQWCDVTRVKCNKQHNYIAVGCAQRGGPGLIAPLCKINCRRFGPLLTVGLYITHSNRFCRLNHSVLMASVAGVHYKLRKYIHLFRKYLHNCLLNIFLNIFSVERFDPTFIHFLDPNEEKGSNLGG